MVFTVIDYKENQSSRKCRPKNTEMTANSKTSTATVFHPNASTLTRKPPTIINRKTKIAKTLCVGTTRHGHVFIDRKINPTFLSTQAGLDWIQTDPTSTFPHARRRRRSHQSKNCKNFNSSQFIRNPQTIIKAPTSSHTKMHTLTHN